MIQRVVLIFIVVLGISAILLEIIYPNSIAGSASSTRPDGVQALYEFLQDDERGVQRFLEPLSNLDRSEENALIFIVNPSKLGAATDLGSWVEKGNTVVYFMSSIVDDDPILKEFGLTLSPKLPKNLSEAMTQAMVNEATFSCKNDHDLYWCGKSLKLSAGASLYFDKVDPSWQIVIGDGELKTGITKRIGNGRAWIFTDKRPILNQYIDKNDNFELLWNLTENKENIYFDEFHHGFVNPVTKDDSDRAWLLNLFIWFLASILIIFGLNRAVQFGAPAVSRSVDFFGSSDFVAALGGLYEQHQYAKALDGYAKSWTLRVAKALGRTASFSPELLISQLQDRNIVSAEQGSVFRQFFAECEGSGKIERKRANQVINDLEKIFDRIRI